MTDSILGLGYLPHPWFSVLASWAALVGFWKNTHACLFKDWIILQGTIPTQHNIHSSRSPC
jgi:hypothetical protein